MKRRNFITLSTAAMAGALGGNSTTLLAKKSVGDNFKINPEKELNPDTKWLLEAKWGVFAHYLAHTASTKVSEEMNGSKWNKKVNSFRVKELADQLEQVQAPYFFITIGQGGGYYCSPNKTFDNFFGNSNGKFSDRDLIAELAAELVPRGIKMCVYLPAVGKESAGNRTKWQQIIAEWSNRWGKSVSAWWIDGGVLSEPSLYADYNNAFRAGNPNAIISYNTGPLGMGKNAKQPSSEYEDFLAGECNWHLPASGYRLWDKKEYYMGPNISGAQLHFLTFLGVFWGHGEPRFPDELVVGWTKHTNNHGGTISWDVPLSSSGVISDSCIKQLSVLSKSLKEKIK